MDALKDVKIPTQEYKYIQSDISKAETELGKLLEKQAQMQREGKSSGAAWDTLNQKIQASKDYVKEAQNELQSLVESGKAFTLGTETEKYKEWETNAINTVIRALNSLHLTLNCNGEDFAHAFIPDVLSELGRLGYNVEIVLGTN